MMVELRLDRSVAVVIGIDEYGHGITSLRTVVFDAQALPQILAEGHQYKVHELVNQQARNFYRC